MLLLADKVMIYKSLKIYSKYLEQYIKNNILKQNQNTKMLYMQIL